MKRQNEQLKLREALREFLSDNHLQDGLNKVDVKDAWRSQMGNGVNHYTTNVQLKRDILYVDLSSSVLRQELSYGKEKIIKILNEYLEKQLIKKIILR